MRWRELQVSDAIKYYANLGTYNTLSFKIHKQKLSVSCKRPHKRISQEIYVISNHLYQSPLDHLKRIITVIFLNLKSINFIGRKNLLM